MKYAQNISGESSAFRQSFSRRLAKNKLNTVLSSILAAGAVTAAATPSAYAQDGEQARDVITVTAQKREESVQDVPIAISVVNSAQIASSGINEMTELGVLVPGLNIIHTVGTLLPSIRGVSASLNVVENPTALYIDGVYLPNPREGMRELADIEQIAVLKGPQGTLFGRNATAGVIQITTKAPQFEPAAEITLGYDNFETFRASGYFTAGLSDNLAASFAVVYADQGEGFGESLSSGFDIQQLRKNLSLRGKLLFQPTERTEITLIGEYLDREDSGANYIPYEGTTFAYPGFGPITDPRDTYAGTEGWNAFENKAVSLQIDHDLDFAKLVSITAYRKGGGGFRFDFDNVEENYVRSTGGWDNESITQELQLISPSGGRLQWVAGVYYFHNDQAYPFFPREINGFPPLAFLSLIDVDSSEVSESIAPFVQMDFELFPSTTFTAGARFTHETRELFGEGTVVLASGPVITQPLVSPSKIEINKPTWRFALNHKFTDDISAYISYNRGLKSGGFNIGAVQVPGYLPEILDAYEVGVKSRLMDGRVLLNLGGFYYEYENLQVITFDTGTQPFIKNGAAAEMYGFEADFQASLTEELTFGGGLSLVHSEFTDYPNALITTPNPAGGAIFSSGSAAGNRLPYAQEVVGNFVIDYRKPIGDVVANLNVTGAYNGDFFFEPDNFVHQPSYLMLNSSLRISDPDDRLSLTFGVSNILDKDVITRNLTFEYAYLVEYGGAPRIYSVRAGVRF